ncbi:alpha/beta fold hydrolase [Streptomyces sp. NPDC086010]|uniref:alpha/beta fold hydrolase n=1 Tax=Streptomyces sp. NPDC086010 TaxID=3365745 RepID=UPI0037D78F38
MPQPTSAAEPSSTVPGAVHRLVDVPGGRIHLLEQGSGPLVLMVHGFPETSYSWRHQLPAVAAAGFRAVAVDVRGYGRSSAPDSVDAYRMTAHVADNVGVVHALGEKTATVVGHDWGSPIAANSALLRPDMFTAAAMLSVPYAPWNPVRPTDGFARIGGDEEFYVGYFQEPGRAEAETDPDVRGWLAGFYTSLSGDTMPPPCTPSPFFVPAGARMRDRFTGGALPFWLSEDDLDVYSADFGRTGLTGALNRYRNMDRDWEDLAVWAGARLTAPALFIGGSLDSSTAWMADAIAAHPTTLPGLVSSHILEGAGHWIQQERVAEVNALLTAWLRSVHA